MPESPGPESPGSVRSESLPVLEHWIGGLTVESGRGRTSPVFDPALGHKNKLAAILTSEHGKVLSDVLGEISRDLEVVTGFPYLLKGEHSENVSTSVDVYSVTQLLVTVEPVADELIEKIASRMSRPRVGDRRRKCDRVVSCLEIEEQDSGASSSTIAVCRWRLA